MRSVGHPVTITLLLSVAAMFTYLGYRMLSSAPTVGQQPNSPVRSELAANLPEFALTNLAGESQSIKSWPGHALIINFWATWCTPCIREIPLLKEFQETNSDKPIQVVGIAVDRFEPVKNFAKDMTFNYPVLIGQSEAMDAANAFGVDFYGLPFSVFTDTNGSVLGVHTGELKSGDLDKVLNLLNSLESGATDLRAAKAMLAEKM